MTAAQKGLVTSIVRGAEDDALAARALDTHRRPGFRLAGVPREAIIDYAVEQGANRARLNTEMA